MNAKTMDAFLDAAGAVDTAANRVALAMKEHSVPPALQAAGSQALANLVVAADTLKSIASMVCKLEQLENFESGRVVRRKTGDE